MSATQNVKALMDEGLLEALPGGGFVVRAFTEGEVHDAIEVRSTMEGLAARLAAERGVAASLLADVRDCLAQIDAVLEAPLLKDDSFGIVVLDSAFRPDALHAKAA